MVACVLWLCVCGWLIWRVLFDAVVVFLMGLGLLRGLLLWWPCFCSMCVLRVRFRCCGVFRSVWFCFVGFGVGVGFRLVLLRVCCWFGVVCDRCYEPVVVVVVVVVVAGCGLWAVVVVVVVVCVVLVLVLVLLLLYVVVDTC